MSAYELTGTEITYLTPRRSILKQAIEDVVGITLIFVIVSVLYLLAAN
jgi:hypothetical protein